MKATLVMVVAALGLVTGCATYVGSTEDESGTVYGSDSSEFVDPTRNDMGRGHRWGTEMVRPVYKQPSPNGHEMGGTRPELDFRRY